MNITLMVPMYNVHKQKLYNNVNTMFKFVLRYSLFHIMQLSSVDYILFSRK